MQLLWEEIQPGLGLFGVYLLLCAIVWAVGMVAEGVDKRAPRRAADLAQLSPEVVGALCGGVRRQLFLDFVKLLRAGHVSIEKDSGIRVVNSWPPKITVLQREILYVFSSRGCEDPCRLLGFEEERECRKEELQEAGLWVPSLHKGPRLLFLFLVLHRVLAILSAAVCTFATLYCSFLPLNFFGQESEEASGIALFAGMVIFGLLAAWVYRPLHRASGPARRALIQKERTVAAGFDGWVTPKGRATFEQLSRLGSQKQLEYLMGAGMDLEFYWLAIGGEDFLKAQVEGVPDELWWQRDFSRV